MAISGGHHSGHSSGGHHSGGGGFRSSSGGNYSGRSSGGSSFGGWGRSGSNRGRSGGGWNSGPIFSSGPRPTGGGAYTPRGGGMGIGCLSVIIIIVVITVIFMAYASFMSSPGPDTGSYDNTRSTIERTRLTGVPAFDSDCIIDEEDWIGDTGRVLKGMESFYDQTGVQPVLMIKSYDASVVGDAAQEKWANAWYDSNINQENVFLIVYFVQEYEPRFNGQGYMVYVTGTQANGVVDEEAINIFWDRFDRYLYEDSTVSELFHDTYQNTGETIMKVSTTTKDIVLWLIIAVIVIALAVFIFHTIRERNRRAREKAAETERILKTPLKKAVDEMIDEYAGNDAGRTSVEDTIERYSSGEYGAGGTADDDGPDQGGSTI